MKQTSEWIAEHYPIFNDPESLIREGYEKSEVYGGRSVEMHNLAKLLNIENIVLLDKSAGTYRFVWRIPSFGASLCAARTVSRAL